MCHTLPWPYPQPTEPSWPTGLGEVSSGDLGDSVGAPCSLESEKTPPLPLVSGQSSCGALGYGGLCLGHALGVRPRQWTQAQEEEGSPGRCSWGGWRPYAQVYRGGLVGVRPGHRTVGRGALGRPQGR